MTVYRTAVSTADTTNSSVRVVALYSVIVACKDLAVIIITVIRCVANEPTLSCDRRVIKVFWTCMMTALG